MLAVSGRSLSGWVGTNPVVGFFRSAIWDGDGNVKRRLSVTGSGGLMGLGK